MQPWKRLWRNLRADNNNMAKTHKIGITGWGSISALGFDPWQAYLHTTQHHLTQDAYGNWLGRLPFAAEARVTKLCVQNKYYTQVDRSVLLAITAAEQAMRMSEWDKSGGLGIQIGSSRGATNTWEYHYQQFEGNSEIGLSPLASPLTTLGNVSSWVSYHLQQGDMVVDHSVTCSTALHAILSGITWLESGRVKRYLAGGTEAPLTPFTISQMRALRLITDVEDEPYPVRALDTEKKRNGMALGEGAVCFCLEKDPEQAYAYIEGIGFSTEWAGSPTGVSREAGALQRSMRMALNEAGLSMVDAVIAHAPGTIQGDKAELEAIRHVLGEKVLISNNKWKLGHTLGASGGLSVEFGLLMLLQRQFIGIPYLAPREAKAPETIMVNGMGFGGNAVSILLRKSNREVHS
jgi:3-oxoacyl-[acyl-carrier-protein] synthase II